MMTWAALLASTDNWMGWSSIKPRLFRLATFVAFGVCAEKKSFNATPLSSKETDPVGQTKLAVVETTVPLVMVSHVLPLPFATSTRKM